MGKKLTRKEERDLFNLITDYVNSISIVSQTDFNIIFYKIKEKYFLELEDNYVLSIIVDILFKNNTFEIIADKKAYHTNLEEISNRIINFILDSNKHEKYPIEFIKIISIMQKKVPDIFYTFLKRIKETNTQNKNINFEYPSSIEFFKNSHFYIYDQIDVEYQVHFKNRDKLEPLVLFYFLEESNHAYNYLLLYSNKVLLIYDLLFGSDSLTEIFQNCFQDFAIVPINEIDIDILSNFIDLSNNFFLDSNFFSFFYSFENEFRNILNEILRFFNIQNKCIVVELIKLIIHYVPLIGVVTNDFQLCPSNFKSKELPEFNLDDFITFTTIKNDIKISLYKKTLEIYLLKMPEIEYYNDCEVKLYEKIYNKYDDLEK